MPAKPKLKSKLPKWMAQLNRTDFRFDGGSSPTQKIWDGLVWSRAWLDMGPSVAGNPGPYWHVPWKDGNTIHRLYPRILETKWFGLIRHAVNEAVTRERNKFFGLDSGKSDG